MGNDNKVIRIKRYSNRKLYDTTRSRYVTLSELGELIRGGANIVVIDNDTKADLTDVTLTQVLITQQKQKQNGLRNLVQAQAEMLLQRFSVPVQQIRDEAVRQLEKQLDKIKRLGEPASGDADGKTGKGESCDNVENSKDTLSTEDDSKDTSSEKDSSNIDEAKPVSSLDLKLEALKTSSDEKLISLMLVQRLEELESEVGDLRRRLELLERKDDERY